MRDRKSVVTLLAVVVGLVCWWLAGLNSSEWGAVVSGQTVPRTPPPTWTRTPRATPARTATGAPTVPPTATSTLAPGAPTPVPQPQLWIALAAQPEVVGPDSMVEFSCRIGNRGNAPAGRAELSLALLGPLVLERAASSRGEARTEDQKAILALDVLEAGGEVTLIVQARVSLNASPGRTYLHRAQLLSEGSVLFSNEVIIELPWALLPATGG